MGRHNDLNGYGPSNFHETFKEFLGANPDNLQIQEQDLIKNIEEVKESLDRVKRAEEKLFRELEKKKFKQINGSLVLRNMNGYGISTIIPTD